MSTRRPPPPAARPLSAQEALEEARRSEAARKQAEVESAQRAALAQKLAEEARARVEAERARRAAEEEKRRAEQARRDAIRRDQEARESEEQMARDRAMSRTPAPRANTRTGPLDAPINEGRVHAILKRLADDIEILEVFGDIRPDVLGVLWQAHVKRARIEKDLPTLALALALAARFEQKPKAMLAARVQWHGKDWAVWVDTERKEVLAALTPADRYLTGL